MKREREPLFADLTGPRAHLRTLPEIVARYGHVPFMELRSSEPPFRVVGVAADPCPFPRFRLWGRNQ